MLEWKDTQTIVERLVRGFVAGQPAINVHRRGHSPEDAQDLTQEFFAQVLAG